MSDTVKCKYCGEEYSTRGITNHEKYCDENLEYVPSGELRVRPKVSQIIVVNGNPYNLKKQVILKVPEKVALLLEKADLVKVV